MTVSPLETLLPAGSILDEKYRTERVLGQGGMGIVVLAHHLGLDEKVAIKLLNPGALSSPGAETRFLQEARIAAKLRSPYAVRILDVGRDRERGLPYIVMEYLEGHNLGEPPAPMPMPISEAVDSMVETCAALAEAHRLGIVHRDIKPQNLFCMQNDSGDAQIKLLDFGISKSENSLSQTSTSHVLGTPSYMSPEQLRTTKSVDARSDIWSIGVTLHALLAGSPPWMGETSAVIAAKILRDAPPTLRDSLTGAPEPLERIILRCLEKDPSARYDDVGALAEELAPFGGPRSQRAIGILRSRQSLAGDSRNPRNSVEVPKPSSAGAFAPTELNLATPLPATAAPPVSTLPSAGTIVPAKTPLPDEATRTASAWGEASNPVAAAEPLAFRAKWPVLAAAVAFAAIALYVVLRPPAPGPGVEPKLTLTEAAPVVSPLSAVVLSATPSFSAAPSAAPADSSPRAKPVPSPAPPSKAAPDASAPGTAPSSAPSAVPTAKGSDPWNERL
jgi:serine/threonine protein kinase